MQTLHQKRGWEWTRLHGPFVAKRFARARLGRGGTFPEIELPGQARDLRCLCRSIAELLCAAQKRSFTAGPRLDRRENGGAVTTNLGLGFRMSPCRNEDTS